MGDPKITVLMSVYNGEKYLREAIDSILSQTFKDFEFIIINDGSTDSSKEIILSYDDSRIRLIDNGKNIGLTKSLNRGIDLAKAPYILKMDADDVSYPERAERMCEVLKNYPEVGLVSTAYKIIDEEGKTLSIIRNVSESILIKEGLLGVNIINSAFMFRQDCAVKIGSYEDRHKYAQDYDFSLKISEKWNVFNLDQVLLKYRIHGASISANKANERAVIDNVIREEALKRQNEEERTNMPYPLINKKLKDKYGVFKLSYIFNDFGCHYIKLNFFKLAKREFLISLKICPFNLKTYYYLFIRLLLNRVSKNG